MRLEKEKMPLGKEALIYRFQHSGYVKNSKTTTTQRLPKGKLAFYLFFLLVLNAFSLSAQPTLPDIGALSQNGVNILTWINPYEKGVKTISVERSKDSTDGFTTIGNVKATKNAQSYVDAHPLLGANYYKVTITFNSNIQWSSNTVKLFVDSASIESSAALPSNDSIQKLIEQVGDSSIIGQLAAVSYPRSRYVFTNPFTGNINIEIDDAPNNKYTLIFLHDKKQVIEIKRIRQPIVILDKLNFQKTGMYEFKLFKNDAEFETGYITIY